VELAFLLHVELAFFLYVELISLLYVEIAFLMPVELAFLLYMELISLLHVELAFLIPVELAFLLYAELISLLNVELAFVLYVELIFLLRVELAIILHVELAFLLFVELIFLLHVELMFLSSDNFCIGRILPVPAKWRILSGEGAKSVCLCSSQYTQEQTGYLFLRNRSHLTMSSLNNLCRTNLVNLEEFMNYIYMQVLYSGRKKASLFMISTLLIVSLLQF
jgi:hypothetical protein